MCKKHNPRKIDSCIKELIVGLNFNGIKTLACCCGHGKYPMSIVIKSSMTGRIVDICSNRVIPRKKRFYKKDKQGYYFIPEVVLNKPEGGEISVSPTSNEGI